MKKLLLFILLLGSGAFVFILNYNNTEYSNEAFRVIKKEHLEIEVFSTTLEKALEENNYIEDKINSYLDITYLEKDGFIDKINSLLELEYTAEEINKIFGFLSDNTIDNLTTNISDIIYYADQDYFNEEYLERYVNYFNNNDYDAKDAIVYVNIGLDNDFYTNTITVSNPDDLLVLVNKYNLLPSDYEADDLVSFEYATNSSKKLREVAAKAFEVFAKDARNNGINIWGASAYRSYSTQDSLYKRYVNEDGIAEADTYSARPGSSEHQTGLAIDVVGSDWTLVRENNKEYLWYKDILHEYGFIIRYPKDKTYITGYKFEPWHLRYVGVEIATYIYENDITYDEYIATQKKD